MRSHFLIDVHNKTIAYFSDHVPNPNRTTTTTSNSSPSLSNSHNTLLLASNNSKHTNSLTLTTSIPVEHVHHGPTQTTRNSKPSFQLHKSMKTNTSQLVVNIHHKLSNSLNTHFPLPVLDPSLHRLLPKHHNTNNNNNSHNACKNNLNNNSNNNSMFPDQPKAEAPACWIS